MAFQNELALRGPARWCAFQSAKPITKKLNSSNKGYEKELGSWFFSSHAPVPTPDWDLISFRCDPRLGSRESFTAQA